MLNGTYGWLGTILVIALGIFGGLFLWRSCGAPRAARAMPAATAAQVRDANHQTPAFAP